MKRLLAAVLFAVGYFASAIPNGYGDVRLGMSVDAVKDALKKNKEFGYRGDRDVSLAPAVRMRGKNDNDKKEENVIIETDAANSLVSSYFSHCWFQFIDGKLSVITLNLDAQKVDHYSVFQKLCEKYGNPQELSPQRSVWTDDGVQLSLERPLVLKYIDKQAADDKQKASGVEKTNSERRLDEFLDTL